MTLRDPVSVLRAVLALALALVLAPATARADCNGNGIGDSQDIESGTSLDCNGDLVPDECEQSLTTLGQLDTPLSLPFVPEVTTAADLDGDGDLDIVAAAPGINLLLAVLMNTSKREGKEAGGFSRPALYRTVASIGEIATADVDGDGDLDVAAATRQQSLMVYWNNGRGALSGPTLTPLLKRFWAFAAGDLDGDGAVDFAFLHRSDNDIEILRNLGDGTFDPPRLVPLGPDGDRPKVIICEDIDGDGDRDILTVNQDSKNVSILRNDGLGRFPTRSIVPLGGNPTELVAGDLDRSGSLDLVVTSNDGKEPVTILLNPGDGASFERSSFELRGSGLEIADADGDGDGDLLSWASGTERLSLISNDGAGRFRSTVDFGVGPLRKLTPGDFDGDGDADLVAVVTNTRGLAIVWSGEGEALSVSSTTRSLRNNRPPHTGVMADFDSDGDLDYVTGDGGNRTISILINDGRGNYTVKADPGVGTYVNSIAASDFDGDGEMDLVVAPLRDNVVRVHLNRGDAVFQSIRALPGGGNPFYAAPAELNGDGRPDIVVANQATQSVSVFLNTGQAPDLFQPPAIVRVGHGPRGLAPGDFDADGDVDVAVANELSRTVTLLFNNGDATFAAPVHLDSKDPPHFVVAGDWNRDGHLDLSTAHHAQRSVGTFLNGGDGTFGAVRFAEVGQHPYTMRPGDLNGDGHLDLVTTNESESNVSVLLNQGDGTFGVFAHYPTGGGPRFSSPGDVDGDGDVDIVVANRQGRSVTVLLNQSSPRAVEDYAERLCTPLDFQSFSSRSADGTLAVKFTIPARDDAGLLPPALQNSRRFALHHEFLRAVFPDRFPGLTAAGLIGLSQVRVSRDYFIGSIARIESRGGPLYLYSIVTSAAPDEVLTLEEVRGAHETLHEALEPLPLAYAPDLTGQNLLAREAAEGWGDPGFPIYLGIAEPPSDYIAYTRAVGYGRVRLFSGEEFEEANRSGRFTFQDIAVVAIAPRDIEGVVGGIITAVPQGALSHVSIRTARRGTPNAFISQAMDVFAELEGKLVRLEVRQGEYTVREVSREEAEAFWAERPKLSEPRPFDPGYRRLDRFDEMDLGLDADVPAEARYGGKATGLARLQTILNGRYEEYRERGFAVPMGHYLDFMNGNRIPSALDDRRQVTYQEYLEELFALPEFQTDSERRFEALDAFRGFAREHGELPPGLAEELARKIEEVFGSPEVMVRFRSSSNVEDVLEFNGAGLYESTSVCLADTLDVDGSGPSHCDPGQESERTIARALKKVWTSLFTFRAHEERSFFQIPQLSSAMGILVGRAFLDEAANGVAFTGDPTSPRGGCYLVTVQAGEESVVSPEPGVLPEVNVLEVAGGEVIEIVRAFPSTLVPPGEVILADERLRELGALMWHIDQNYPLDAEGSPREDVLLDLEFKLEQDGSLAVKQVRPFLTAGEKSKRPTFLLEVPAGAAVCGRQSLIAPEGDPRAEYERKSVVRFREGLIELRASHCVFAADLVEDVHFGPGEEPARPRGPGVFRVEERPDSSGHETLFTISYRQLFSLEDGRQLELHLVNLEFAAREEVPIQERWVLDEEFILNRLRMFGFVESQTITYSSCRYDSLPSWDVNAELVDGTIVRVRERFEPAADFTLTAPAAVEAAEVFIGGTRHFVSDYWRLVYSSARHNTAVRYWILLDSPATAPGVAAAVHALEFAPADDPELSDIVDVLQPEAVAYLDENLEVLARPEVSSFSRRETPRPAAHRFVRGDADADGSVGVADALRILDYLFRKGDPFDCESAADVDDDGEIDLGDAIHALFHLFRGGPLPPPSRLCDFDPTRDGLDCESFGMCF